MNGLQPVPFEDVNPLTGPGAHSLMPEEIALVHQKLERFPHHIPANLELLAKLFLRGQHLICPVTFNQCCAQSISYGPGAMMTTFEILHP